MGAGRHPPYLEPEWRANGMLPRDHCSFLLLRETVKRRPWPPGKATLDALINDALADANGESEQRTAFYTMIQEHLAVPFECKVLGLTVTVERIDLTDDEQIVAICRHGRSKQAISVLDLPIPTLPPSGAEWIAAYRRWARPRLGRRSQ